MSSLILIVVAGAFAAGLFSGLTGFGTGLIAFGFWLHVVPAKTAAILVLWCSTVGQITSLWFVRKSFSFRRSLPFIVPAIVCVPLGTWLLVLFDPSVFRTGIGWFLVVFTIALLMAGRVTLNTGRFDPWVNPFVGASSGLMGGFAGLPGPLTTLWCNLRGWDKGQQRAIYQPLNFCSVTFGLLSAAAAGLIDSDTLRLCLISTPVTIFAVLIGLKVYDRMNNDHFRVMVLSFLLVSGLSLVLF